MRSINNNTMKKDIKILLITLFFAMGIHTVQAQADYTTYLTSARGFTEVTSTSGLLSGDYYYVLCSAENTGLIVGICPAGDRKAAWAPDNSLAMCYQPVVKDPVLNRKNFWIIEKSGNNIGFRNLYHNVCLFQTNEGQGYLYFAGFYWEHTMSEWDQLIPTYQDGYWTFESGKYPISSGDWASGFLGPWDKVVKEGETMALNRKNTERDLAGHYRLFRIAKSAFESLYNTETTAQIASPIAGRPVDYTSKITNPSFETGDTNGWTVTPTDGSDVGAREYTLSGMEGKNVGNFYTWWGNVSVEQTISNLPAGTYKISALMGTWAQRYTMGFTVNGNTINRKGTGADNGIPVSQIVTLTGNSNSITISAFQNADWWSTGRGGDNSGGLGQDECGFFKIDDVRLTYYSSIPQLPNDETTILTPDIWYYFDAPATGKYSMSGNALGIVYADELPETYTYGNPIKGEMGLPAGRIYFKTSKSNSTLKVEPTSNATTFTAVTLNVDGLPKNISFVELNPDGREGEGASLMSQYISNKGYDIVALSEDFNFHNELISSINSTYNIGTHRANITAAQAVSQADTDGLGLLVKKDAKFSNESWTKFSSSANSWDGSKGVKKGYRYYTITLADGNVIDLFIAHLDAGDDGVNYRPAQLQQIANAIIANGNADRPKIFMGDTNCRWTREDMRTNFMNILSDTYDVGDAWPELVRGGDYPTPSVDPNQDNEVVDKIFYINPKGNKVKKLSAISYRRETDFVDNNGVALGDHAPVVVKFGLALYEEVDNTLILGDVNKDGQISIADVTALVNIILGKDNTSPYIYDHVAADVNQDGSISIADVTALVNIILGKEG